MSAVMQYPMIGPDNTLGLNGPVIPPANVRNLIPLGSIATSRPTRIESDIVAQGGIRAEENPNYVIDQMGPPPPIQPAMGGDSVWANRTIVNSLPANVAVTDLRHGARMAAGGPYPDHGPMWNDPVPIHVPRQA